MSAFNPLVATKRISALGMADALHSDEPALNTQELYGLFFIDPNSLGSDLAAPCRIDYISFTQKRTLATVAFLDKDLYPVATSEYTCLGSGLVVSDEAIVRQGIIRAYRGYDQAKDFSYLRETED